MTASPTVHVVDDDASMRRSLAQQPGGAGHDVALYATAEEFLAAAGPSLTGCILLDLRLPGASGLELQERLVERGCSAPVVFLTGHGDVPASVRADGREAWRGHCTAIFRRYLKDQPGVRDRLIALLQHEEQICLLFDAFEWSGFIEKDAHSPVVAT